jgi:hypothetical protein
MRCLLLFLAALLTVVAVAPIGVADDAPLCAQMLTAARLQAALGVSFDDVSDPVIYADGHSQCSFLTGGGKKNVMLTFLNLRAIQEGMISAESIPAYYDMNVRSTEETLETKGTPVKGVGVRAVLFDNPEVLRMMIETKKGFAEISASGLSAKEMEAVGRAAVAPPDQAGQ